MRTRSDLLRLRIVVGIVVATLLPYRAAQAQERTILRATVVDSLSRPLAGARIRSTTGVSAITDSSGRVGFSVEHRDRVSVFVSMIGFKPETVQVSFAGRQSVDTVLVMKQVAVVLSTVSVRSDVPERYRGIARYEDFYERRRTAIGGTFFDREKLERIGSVVWALNTIPGVRASEYAGSVGARFARCPSGKIAVIIDGVYLATRRMGDIRTFDVETMEVYTGVTQIPAVARGDACAAVVVTTWMVATPRDSTKP